MAFYAYILRCADGSYYTGHTDNLDHRIGMHQTGTADGYTFTRRPVSLVWSQGFPSRIEALEAERRIKGWTRAKKEALIAGDWDQLSILARNHQDERSPSTGSGRTGFGTGALSSSVHPEPVEGHVRHPPRQND